MVYKHKEETIHGALGLEEKEYSALIQTSLNDLESSFRQLFSSKTTTEKIEVCLNILGLEHTEQNQIKMMLLIDALKTAADTDDAISVLFGAFE